LRESVCINHSFGSSGLNLACEGLLLGMRKGDRKETPMKLHLTQRTFINIMIVNTFIVCFTERDSLTQRRRTSDLRQHHDCQYLHRLLCRKGQSHSKAKLRFGRRPGQCSLERSSSGDSKATEGYKSSEVPQMKPPSSGHVLAYDW
jgi:hypothetical protein